MQVNIPHKNGISDSAWLFVGKARNTLSLLGFFLQSATDGSGSETQRGFKLKVLSGQTVHPY